MTKAQKKNHFEASRLKALPPVGRFRRIKAHVLGALSLIKIMIPMIALFRGSVTTTGWISHAFSEATET